MLVPDVPLPALPPVDEDTLLVVFIVEPLGVLELPVPVVPEPLPVLPVLLVELPAVEELPVVVPLLVVEP